MEIKEYLRFLRRWFWVIFSVTFLVVLTVFIICYYFLEREYRAETTILLGNIKMVQENNSNKYINTSPDESLIKVYSALAKSDSVLDKIIRDYKLNKSTEELRKDIKVQPLDDSGIIKIIVNDNSAENAEKIINSILINLQYESNKISLPATINIIDKVKTPVAPSSPNFTLNIFIACIAGLMGGLILAGVFEVLDTSLKNIKEFENTYSIPILGVISKISKGKRKKTVLANINLIEETYKIITQLNTLFINEKLKVILITSPFSNEGKTTVALKIAESMGNLGKKVLLVNCDFRNINMTDEVYMINDSGLSDYLAEDIDVPMVIPLPNSNLNIVTKGTKEINPVVFLQSQRMVSFINNMRQQYDYILIDSPPLLPVADASILSKLADGIMLVVKYGCSKHEHISRALQNLYLFNAKILGVVINQAPRNL